VHGLQPQRQFKLSNGAVRGDEGDGREGKLEEINDLLARMHGDEIEGRIVLNLSGTRDPIRWLARQQGENYPKRLEGSITV
jgi:hypothetical protein